MPRDLFAEQPKDLFQDNSPPRDLFAQEQPKDLFLSSQTPTDPVEVPGLPSSQRKRSIGASGSFELPEDQSALERYGTGVARGAVGTVGSMLGAVDWLVDSDIARDLSKKAQQWNQEKALADPGFLDDLASGFGSTAIFFIPGLGVTKTAGKLAKVAPKLANWMGVSVSTALESATEAGAVYQDMMDKTQDKDQASRAATNTLLANIPLIAVTNKLGVFADKGGIIKKGITSAILEGLQEVGQEDISAYNTDRKLTNEERLRVFSIGALIGGGFGAITGIGEHKNNQKIKELNKKIENARKVEVKEGPIQSESIEQEYESFKDAWFAEKDIKSHHASVNSAIIQEKIKNTTGEKRYGNVSKDVDRAIQIYIDTKRNPGHIAEFYDKLSPEQKRIVDLSQNLSPEQQAIADEVSRQYDELGLEALDAEVIHNVLDNYVGRIWDVAPPKKSSEQFRKFGTNTRHAKARTFQTIIEGMSNGYNLKIEGATNNLAILKEEIHNTIQDKKFLDQLTKMKDLDGNAILSTTQLPGYVRVEHPNFKKWEFSGSTDPTDPRLKGKNFIQTPEGTILERRELYAPKNLAKDLNNIMGVSKLKGIPWIDAITKYNAVTKSWLLQTSLFHHLAFMRSMYLGSAPFGEAVQKIKSGEGFMKSIKDLTPRQLYKSGLKSIMDLNPELEIGVRNGLTLGKIMDWEEHILRQEDTFVGRTLDKMKVTKDIKDKIEAFREAQADFLFKQVGAGLKAKAYLIEYKNILKKHHGIDPNDAAKIAANLVNDDFGGLHLKRLGRNSTTQHVFRLFALAPDWTESNIRSMVKAFKRGEEGEVYRRFWARIITKAAFATLAANALLHGDELPEVYSKAWKSGKLRHLDVDITPIYKAFGGDTKASKYFSVIGHFHDPLKFAVDPIKAAHYKGSIVYRTIYEAISGEDWAGREFTELPELMETGATVRPKFTFAGSPSKYSQAPSYLISQIKGIQPIQVQQLLNWWMGETEAFDAIGQGLGLGIRTTYEPTPEQKRKEKEIRKTIRAMSRKKK